MESFKNKSFFVINLFLFGFVFLFVLNYMKFDVLSDHGLWYPFSSIKTFLEQGRYLTMATFLFFYQFLPKVFPLWHLNDMQCSLMAFFRSVIILSEAFLLVKIFYAFSKKSVFVFKNKSFIFVFLISFLLLFNHVSIHKVFMFIYDIAIFLDYIFPFLFFLLYVLGIIYFYCLGKTLTIKNTIFYSVIILILSLSNEYYCLITFISLLGIAISLYFKNSKNVDKLKDLFLISPFAQIFTFLVVNVIGALLYFFVSNYSSMVNVGGGHCIDWKEQISLLPVNFIPFLECCYSNLFKPFAFLFILFFLLFTVSFLSKCKYKINVIFFTSLIFIGMMIVNSIFLFIGPTNSDGLFFVAHHPIKYCNMQILCLLNIILSGFLLAQEFTLLKKYIIISSLLLYVFLFIFPNNIGVDYLQKYNSYIEHSKNKRTQQYILDKYFLLQAIVSDAIFLPMDFYEYSNIKFYNSIEESEDMMKNIYAKEKKSLNSRLFIRDKNFQEKYNNNYDNQLFEYFENVHHINPKVLIYYAPELLKEHPLYSIMKVSDKELSNIKFSNILKVKSLVIDTFEKRIFANKNSCFTYLAIAKDYEEMGKYELALGAYNKAVLYDDKFYISRYLRGVFLRDVLGQKKEAEEDLKIVSEKYPYSILQRELLAKLMYENGHYDKAIELYTDLISVFPWGSTHSQKDYYMRRGLVYMNGLKKYNLAMNDFLESEKINEFSFLRHLYEYTGDCRVQLGDKEQAIEDYTNELSYNPENTAVYFRRGMLYFEKGDFEKAYEDIEKFYELSNNEDVIKFLEEIREKL